MGAQPHQVAGDALQFDQQHARHGGAFGDIDAHQFFDGQHIAEVV